MQLKPKHLGEFQVATAFKNTWCRQELKTGIKKKKPLQIVVKGVL